MEIYSFYKLGFLLEKVLSQVGFELEVVVKIQTGFSFLILARQM
jgi:hypothetical protein